MSGALPIADPSGGFPQQASRGRKKSVRSDRARTDDQGKTLTKQQLVHLRREGKRLLGAMARFYTEEFDSNVTESDVIREALDNWFEERGRGRPCGTVERLDKSLVPGVDEDEPEDEE